MMPDTVETRVGRLEQQFSALKQQVSDVAHDVETLAPVQMAVVRIETTVSQIDRDIAGLRAVIEKDRDAAKERGKELAGEITRLNDQVSEQARATKTQLIGGTISIIVTLLTIGGTIVVAGLGG